MGLLWELLANETHRAVVVSAIVSGVGILLCVKFPPNNQYLLWFLFWAFGVSCGRLMAH